MDVEVDGAAGRAVVRAAVSRWGVAVRERAAVLGAGDGGVATAPLVAAEVAEAPSAAGGCDSGRVRPTGVTSSGVVVAGVAAGVDAVVTVGDFAEVERVAGGFLAAAGFRAAGDFAAGAAVGDTGAADVSAGFFAAAGFLAAGLAAAGFAPAGFAAAGVPAVDFVAEGFVAAGFVAARGAAGSETPESAPEIVAAAGGVDVGRFTGGRFAAGFFAAGFAAALPPPGAVPEARSPLVGLSGSGVGGKEVTKQTYQAPTTPVGAQPRSRVTCENPPWSVTNWTRQGLSLCVFRQCG